MSAFDRVLAIDPKHAISWNNRGNTFVAMRRLEEAVASFDKALALKPDLEIAQNNRMLALLELKRVPRIPAHAVRALFDDYSSYYDAAMLEALSYQGPQHLRALLERVLARRGGAVAHSRSRLRHRARRARRSRIWPPAAGSTASTSRPR